MPIRGRVERKKKVDKSTGLGGSAVVLSASACSASRLLSRGGWRTDVLRQTGQRARATQRSCADDARGAVSPSPRSVDLVFMELALGLAFYAMRSTLADASLDVLHARAARPHYTRRMRPACRAPCSVANEELWAASRKSSARFSL